MKSIIVIFVVFFSFNLYAFNIDLNSKVFINSLVKAQVIEKKKSSDKNIFDMIIDNIRYMGGGNDIGIDSGGG